MITHITVERDGHNMDLQALADDFDQRDWQETTETNEPIRFAMIGVGWWTREQAMPAVADADLCETTVLVSGDRKKAAEVATMSETVEHVLTYEEFHNSVASDAYDAVYIVTPNARHLPFVETAAALDKAILCEKPIEATIERAERIVEVCDEHNAVLMVAYRMHTEPAVRRAKNLIDQGVIGDPLFIHGNMTEPILELVPDPNQWRLDGELSGGCAVMDIGLYPLNTSRFLLEESPVRVRGMVASVHEEFEDVPDEHGVFQLDYPNHVYAVCTASQNAYSASHISVLGSDGQLRIEPAFYPWDDRALTVSRGGTTFEIDFEQVDQMEEEFEYFSHCLLTGTMPYADGEYGLVDIKTIKAVYEASETGATVTLE
jgi:predicted dehydrogenase